MGTMTRTALEVTQQNQSVVPTSGQTVQVTDNAIDTLLVLSPAALLAALTVALPSDVNSRINQIVRIATMKAITILTVTGATSIMNAPTSLILGGSVSFQKVAANTWVKL